jgi:hypothetical protein
MTARNGATTYTIAASQGTYVGTLFVDGTNGQATCTVDVGQSRKWALWNAYNQVPILLQVRDSTANWTYGTATYRPSSGVAANSLTISAGLPTTPFDLQFTQAASNQSNTTFSNQSLIGIGYNSTTTPAAGSNQGAAAVSVGAAAYTVQSMMTAFYIAPPTIGNNVITCLEDAITVGGSSSTFYGGGLMLLTAKYFG